MSDGLIYCRVPARWGLQQTTLGSGQRQDTGPGILWSVHRWTNSYLQKNLKRTDRTFDPFLLRQGEPGTSQYICITVCLYVTFTVGLILQVCELVAGVLSSTSSCIFFFNSRNGPFKVTRYLCFKIRPLLHVSVNNYVARPSFKHLRGFLTKWPRMPKVYLHLKSDL